MLIDKRGKLRELLLKLVPIPNNKDVIYYDNRFIDLISIDVQKLYNDELLKFKDLEKQYSTVNKKVNEYNERLDNLKLINNKMTEKEYIAKIQELEIQYSKEYRDIKQIESKMSSYRMKILDLNDKIEIQKANEIKLAKLKIQKTIDSKKDILNKLSNLKIMIDLSNNKLEILNEKLQFYREQYNLYNSNYNDLCNDKFTCNFCGIEMQFENRRKYGSLITKMEKKCDEIDNKTIAIKHEIQSEFDYKTKLLTQQKELREKLNNIKNFEQQEDIILYSKKSLTILKLEASKFEIEEQLDKLNIDYTSRVKKAGIRFSELKNDINNYKQSLLNLHDIKESKEKLKEDMKEYDEIVTQAKQLKADLLFHCEFLMTRNKLREKNLSDLFDGKLKFELFYIDDVNIKNTLNITYNNVKLENLNPQEEEIVENMILDKVKLLTD